MTAASKSMTTCKDAIAKWKLKSGQEPSEAKKVSLICQLPSIRKMDASLNALTNCEILSLGTNAIDAIKPLSLKKLKILSLGRNNIKSVPRMDELAPCLEQLWISYNGIDKLDGVASLKNLKVLFISNNNIKTFDELLKLRDLPLIEILLVGNPCYGDLPAEVRRIEVLRRLPKLEKLDGNVVSADEREKAQNQRGGLVELKAETKTEATS